MNLIQKWSETDFQAQLAIVMIFVTGGVLTLQPSMLKESKLLPLILGLFLMTAGLNLAIWYMNPKRKEKGLTYKELLDQMEKPKNRWGK